MTAHGQDEVPPPWRLPVPGGGVWSYALLVSVCALCYGNSLRGEFVHDDVWAIVNNPDVRPGSSLRNIFFNDFWGKRMADNTSHKSYRPLCILAFKLNVLLGGMTPLYFHVVNVLLHCAVTALLMLACERTVFQDRRLAFLTALLFAVHPVHTEAVSGIVGRADVLACLLFLLTFLSYTRSVDHSGSGDRFPPTVSAGWLALSLLLGTCAMLVKETGVTVFGVCVVYDVLVICQKPLVSRAPSPTREAERVRRCSGLAATVHPGCERRPFSPPASCSGPAWQRGQAGETSGSRESWRPSQQATGTRQGTSWTGRLASAGQTDAHTPVATKYVQRNGCYKTMTRTGQPCYRHTVPPGPGLDSPATDTLSLQDQDWTALLQTHCPSRTRTGQPCYRHTVPPGPGLDSPATDTLYVCVCESIGHCRYVCVCESIGHCRYVCVCVSIGHCRCVCVSIGHCRCVCVCEYWTLQVCVSIGHCRRNKVHFNSPVTIYAKCGSLCTLSFECIYCCFKLRVSEISQLFLLLKTLLELLLAVVVVVWEVTVIMSFRLWIMGGSMPLFSEQDNPASFSPHLLTRLLTYSYLLAFNAWLLLAPIVLCYDWQVGSIPLLESVWDVRNAATCLFGVAMVCLCLHCLASLQLEPVSCQPVLWEEGGCPRWAGARGTGVVLLRPHEGQKLENREVLVGILFLVFPFIPASNLFFRVGFVVAERVLYMPRTSQSEWFCRNMNRFGLSRRSAAGHCSAGVIAAVDDLLRQDGEAQRRVGCPRSTGGNTGTLTSGELPAAEGRLVVPDCSPASRLAQCCVPDAGGVKQLVIEMTEKQPKLGKWGSRSGRDLPALDDVSVSLRRVRSTVSTVAWEPAPPSFLKKRRLHSCGPSEAGSAHRRAQRRAQKRRAALRGDAREPGLLGFWRTPFTPFCCPISSSMGYCILVVHGLSRLCSVVGRWGAPALTLSLLLLLLLFSWKTVQQNETWLSREALFRSGIQTLPHNAKVHYNYANFLKDQGRNQEAIHHYETALKTGNKAESQALGFSHKALMLLAICFSDRDSSLFVYFSKRLYPRHASAMNNLGTLTRGAEEAERHYRRALEINPQHNRALFNLGNLLNLHFLAACCMVSMPVCTGALQGWSPSHNDSSLCEHGWSLVHSGNEPCLADQWIVTSFWSLEVDSRARGKEAEAEQLLRDSVQLGPHFADAYSSLASLLAEQRRFGEANEVYLQGIENCPDSSDLHNNYGVFLVDTGDGEGAAAHYQQAIQLKPSHYVAMVNLGRLLRSSGQNREAEAWYRRALQVTRRVEILTPLGALYYNTGRYEEALQVYREATELQPNNGEIWLALAQVLAMAGRAKEAEEMTFGILSKNTACVECYRLLSAIYSKRGSHNEALDALDKAIQLNMGDLAMKAELHFSKGNQLREMNLLEQAFQSYRLAVELNPDQSQAWMNMGGIQHIKGDYVLARVYYEKALQLSPGSRLLKENLAKLDRLEKRLHA
ncbi:TMTC1 protein, partial [Atractosteus spatula]|nr:TMTC1 protein [Atractosteus spatula]